MPWKVVERKIGRAGGLKQRTTRQREWDRKYGEENWAVGYVIDGAFVLQEEALESVYNRSYEEHFAAHPEDLAELIRLLGGFKKKVGPAAVPVGALRDPRLGYATASR